MMRTMQVTIICDKWEISFLVSLTVFVLVKLIGEFDRTGFEVFF